MTEKASTKKLGSKTPSTEISGDVDKVAGAPQQDDEKVPVEGEHMPRAIAQFLLELNVGLNTLDKLYDSTYYEFDKIMLDDTGSDDPIDVSELLEMNAFLEIL